MIRQKRDSLFATLTLIGIFILSACLQVRAVDGIPLCFFKYLTHLDCPGCGLTRSFISLSHGQWRDAIHYNVLGPILYLYLLAYLFKHLIFLFRQIQWHWRLPVWLQWTFGVLVAGQWFWKLMFS